MISKKEVENIAKLARLELSSNEIVKLQKDLSEVLEYFNLLKKVKDKTSSVINRGERAIRKDEAKPQEKKVVEVLVEAAPDKKENHIKVKTVF